MNSDMGLIDVEDILSFFCALAKRNELKNRKAFINDFFLNSAGNLIDQSNNDRVFPVKPTVNLEELINIIITKDVRRVMIEDEKNQFIYTSALTQTDIVKFIFYNLGDLIKDSKKPISHFKMDQPALTVKPKDITFEVFERMKKEEQEQAVVPDEEGTPIASLTASALLSISPDNYEDVFLPVIDFVTKHKVEPLTVCKPSTPFKNVLKVIVDNKIHQVYVNYGDDKTPGVITLRSIIKVLDCAVEHHINENKRTFSSQINKRVHKRVEVNMKKIEKKEDEHQKRLREVMRIAKSKRKNNKKANSNTDNKNK